MARGLPLVTDPALKQQILTELCSKGSGVVAISKKYNLPKKSLYEWRCKGLERLTEESLPKQPDFIEVSPSIASTNFSLKTKEFEINMSGTFNIKLVTKLLEGLNL